jgi:hypothetical protein
LSHAELEAKFRLLTRDLISEEHSQRLRAAILGLPGAKDVLTLTQLLRY